MTETINVRIKMFPGNPPRPATTKVFLSTEKNARPLEPGEIVQLPAHEAKQMLAHLPYELEITTENANRPVIFESHYEAAITSSQNTKVSRSEVVRANHQAAVAQMREEMAKLAELRAREEAVAKREAELGMQEAPEPVEDEPDDDYIPKNNAVVQEEIDRIRKQAAREAEEAEAVAAASAPTGRKRRGRQPKPPQPESAA